MAVSGFVVRVPEAEPLVGDLRLRHDESARLGMAAHITVLFPFLAPERIDAEVCERVRVALGSCRAFDFALATVGRFPATAYLAPEPADAFVALTDALARAFLDHPPFGGVFDRVIPHLTVAHGDAAAAVQIEPLLAARLGAHGPPRSSCRTIELVGNATGRWAPLHHFELRR